MKGTALIYLVFLIFSYCTTSNGMALQHPDNHILIQNVYEEVKKIQEDIVTLKTKGCPEHSLIYLGSCYFVPLWTASWEGAQRTCQYMGSHLATLETAQENEEVRKYAAKVRADASNKIIPGQRFWIGLYDIDKNHFWVWVNAKKCGYTKWNSGFPKYQGNKEYVCVNMLTGSGTWLNDHACKTLNFFMCEKEL